jgi:hypothetical protein
LSGFPGKRAAFFVGISPRLQNFTMAADKILALLTVFFSPSACYTRRQIHSEGGSDMHAGADCVRTSAIRTAGLLSAARFYFYYFFMASRLTPDIA